MSVASPSGKREISPAGLRESRAARVALGLVALYVLDDNFVHPEIGTAARDHLLSGLVPVLVLLGLALGYPRLRAGTRAVVALACGALAIVAGITDGLRHISVDALSG